MLKHYILTSWRNIVRNKFYSIILTLGLAVGIASSLLLWMYTWHELSYDNFHEKKERIYLVAAESKKGTEEDRGGWTTPPTGPALEQYFPEIETFTRVCTWFDEVVVTREDKKYVEDNLKAADSTVFKVFTIPFIAGDPQTALKEPNSIVITQSTARKYFGDQDPLGQTLHFDHFFSACKVTGVVEDYPDNSHYDFNMLLSLSSLSTIHFDFNHWANHTFATYIVLNPEVRAKTVEARMPQFIKHNLDPFLIRRYQKSYDEMYREGDYYNLALVPLKDVHLSTLLYENQEGKKLLVYALGAIGLIIIVLVCINYTNLATVLSLGRAREAGIRKVTGSRSDLLFKQFLTESVIIAFIGLFIGIGLVEFCLPFFNMLTKQSLQLNYLNPLIAGTLILFTLGLGLLSGFYPAITFASFNPVSALKGNAGIKGRRPWLRNGLVVFQFTVCIIMIVSTLVVYKQLTFMTGKNLGFAKDQVVVIRRPEGLKENKIVFKNELLKQTGIQSVSYTETKPGGEFNGHGQHLQGTPSTEMPVIYPFIADADILETLDLEIVEGTGFKGLNTKRPKAILNEAAVKQLGLHQALTAKIDIGTMGRQEVDIIGVVKDFHFKSFHHAVEPLVFYSLDVEHDPQHRVSYALVKINGQHVVSTLKYIEGQWKKFAGNYPFEYSFLNDDFNALFEREARMARVYTLFSVICIAIACLGLLGLISFFANRRSKEISIRKIVGASLADIALMLSGDFVKLLFIAIVTGSVCAWYLMSFWMEKFVYRTEVSWWIFAVAGGSVLVVSLLTVSWHLYRAGSRNPVETLKYE
jgi:putative ABC transport system permease protein